MNFFKNNIDQLRNIVNELYSYVGMVGAYSDLASEIESSCANLSKAIDEYENQIKEKGLL